MYGCELGDDGSARGYSLVGYDGEDFLAVDPLQKKAIALTDEAHIAVQILNSPETQAAERTSIYLQTVCIDWLKNLIGYGKEELNRRVRPKVKVSSQNVNGVTKLHCQVYGFYPQDVDVKWQKNGIDVPSHEAKHVLPNSDGTYQIRVTVEVPAKARGYSCHVDHPSLDKTLIVNSDSQWSSNTLWIVIAALAGVMAVSAVGFIIYGKRSGKRQTLYFL
uniref:Ig-like domain-containing protein n=1 Tax=Leptobrachium leishanense TaxID=445787 RepID=A0A8C5MFK2_9ANUR